MTNIGQRRLIGASLLSYRQFLGGLLMSNVLIRDVESKDLEQVKALVIQTWGEAWNLERFTGDKDKLFANLEIYLNVLLNSSTFGRVAVQNDEVVGAIFCSMKGEEKRYRALQEDSTHHTLIMLAASDDERFDTIEHLTKAEEVMNGLYKLATREYDGSIEFLCVSEKAQGLKIGKKLCLEASSYFTSKNARYVNVVTDTSCNFGFYDHIGYSRAVTKEVVFNYSTGQKKLEMFLYDYSYMGG
jgi:ribosomal protein S18 acetylase RimI-like enzyme